MERALRRGERRGYGAAVEDLLEPLGSALVRLERIAEEAPEAIVTESADELPGLQYTLHAGAELALGIDPPASSRPLHSDLVDALAVARDATAEVASAAETGDAELVRHLLPEWRGALFRVRLARLRALERSPFRAPAGDAPDLPTTPAETQLSASALVATGLVVAGALLFTAGAVLAAWPLWAAGLALFAGGFVLFRP